MDMSKFASNKKILSNVMLLEVTLGVIYIYIYIFIGFQFWVLYSLFDGGMSSLGQLNLLQVLMLKVLKLRQNV